MKGKRIIIVIMFICIFFINFSAEATLVFTTRNGFMFDILDTGTGAVEHGTRMGGFYPYNICYILEVNGTVYNNNGQGGFLIYGGRGVQLATVQIGNLEVTRNIYVPYDYDYLRYYDTIKNNGNTPTTVTVSYSCDLTTNYNDYMEITATSNGDLSFEPSDTWFTSTLSSSTSFELGHIWWQEESEVGISDVTFDRWDDGNFRVTYEPITIQPGEEIAIMIFAVQTNYGNARTIVQMLLDPDATALYGLNVARRAKVLNWRLGGAPFINWVTQSPKVSEGGNIELQVEVVDMEGDPYQVSWDFDGDGNFDDAQGTTVTFSALGLDGPSQVVVQVKASDPTSYRIKRTIVEIMNAPPLILNRPETTNLTINQEWSYKLEVQDPAGELDPLRVDVLNKPQGMIITRDYTLKWTPTQNDIGEHKLVITVRDDDDNPAVEGDGDTTLELTLVVLDNQPPSQPQIVYPERYGVVETLQPTIIINNATDPEGDLLSYKFDLDTRDSFNSSDLITSSNIPGDPLGQTSWTVPLPLKNDTYYYIRVKAFDGYNWGPAATSIFKVEVKEGGIEDGGVTDTEVSDTVGEEIKPGGCDCHVATEKEAPISILNFLLLIFVISCFLIRKR